MSDGKRLTYQERIVRGVRQVFDASCLGKRNDCYVRHDVWCGVHSGGSCNCVPDVILSLAKGRFAVDLRGCVREVH